MPQGDDNPVALFHPADTGQFIALETQNFYRSGVGGISDIGGRLIKLKYANLIFPVRMLVCLCHGH